MATSAQHITRALEMNIELTEYSKPAENTLTGHDCIRCLRDAISMDISQSPKVEGKANGSTAENTSKPKKKNKSEKQKERTRQYKKKIRKARRQMAAEKRMVEINNMASQIRILQEHRPETGPTGVYALPPREVLPEPVSQQLKPAVIVEIETLNDPPKAACDETSQVGLNSDDDNNNTADRDDVFGILSVYVESSIHFEFDQGSSDKTVKDDDFGYVYFSMSNFLK